MAYLQKVVSIFQNVETDQLGYVFSEMAKIEKRRGHTDMAVQLLLKAQAAFESQEKFLASDELAETFCKLSQWQEKQSKIEDALFNLQRASEIYEQNYGLEDPQTVRVKRNIALVLLRGNQFQDALKELFEVE